MIKVCEMAIQAKKFSNLQLWKMKDEGLYIPAALKIVNEFNRFQEIKQRLSFEAKKIGQVKHKRALRYNSMKVTWKGDLEEMQLKIMLDNDAITP